jgi:hypothetical protein
MWFLDEEGRLATLRCELDPGPPSAAVSSRAHDDRLYRMIRLFAGRVRSRWPSTKAAAEYTRCSAAPKFEQPATGIYSNGTCSKRSNSIRTPNHKALRVQAEKRISKIAKTTTHAERVREYLPVARPPIVTTWRPSRAVSV